MLELAKAATPAHPIAWFAAAIRIYGPFALNNGVSRPNRYASVGASYFPASEKAVTVPVQVATVQVATAVQ